MKINMITSLHPSVWRRQENPSLKHEWVYSVSPIESDVYVVYGRTDELRFPNLHAPRIFVAIEPPEVIKYDLNVLSRYDLVVSADFPYFKKMSQHRVVGGLLNWSIGVSDHISNGAVSQSLPTIDEILSLSRSSMISTITSLKTITPIQKKRVRLIRHLREKIPELIVFGRDSNPVRDKLDALLPYSYHLAFENSQHPSYWTEKLSDPLICLSKVFYFGDSSCTEIFDPKAVVLLDINNYEECVQTIRWHLSRGISPDTLDALTDSRKTIMSSNNLHSAIEAQIENLKPFQFEIRSEMKQAHKISLLDRLNLQKSSMRLKYIKSWNKFLTRFGITRRKTF